MIKCIEGEKKDVAMRVERTRGSGTITVTSPQVRILNGSRALVSGHDWLPCSYDSTARDLSTLFDSTDPALASGTFYVQFRCTIDAELIRGEVQVRVVEVGP